MDNNVVDLWPSVLVDHEYDHQRAVDDLADRFQTDAYGIVEVLENHGFEVLTDGTLEYILDQNGWTDGCVAWVRDWMNPDQAKRVLGEFA